MLAGSVVALAGCSRDEGEPSVGEPPPNCRTPESLVDFDAVGGAMLGYEETRSATSMRTDPRFLTLLDAWAAEWAELSGYGPITEVWSYGAYVDKCASWHQAGRAFDFTEIVHADGSVSCRFDQWQPGSNQQLRDYWRLAASLHLHFAYTLTYLYDPRHHNHIHVDNSVSGEALSTFDEGSQVQVHLVQECLRSVFGAHVTTTGHYDDQTRDALRPVQAALGITQPLRDPEGWRAFLRAAARG